MAKKKRKSSKLGLAPGEFVIGPHQKTRLHEVPTVHVPAHHAVKDLVVKIDVTGLDILRWRIALAVKVIRLGIWISGAQCKVEVPRITKKGFR